MLTHKELIEILAYDSETGVFTWRKSLNRATLIGSRAGCIDKSHGYWRIQIFGKLYRASRLAWFYHHGYWPEHEIDHINKIRNDDRIKNLRHVSSVCNERNKNKSSRNTSGVVGVTWKKQRKRWCAFIKMPKKLIFLGYFKDFTDAVKARWQAEIRHDFPNCQTTSTAYLYLKDKGII